MRAKRETGIALITVLLIMILVSAIAVGMSWMVMTDQRLGGNNLNRDLAFYGAEAGMETITDKMGNQFALEGTLTATDVTTIEGETPSIPGINYTNASGGSTYQILCGSPLANCNGSTNNPSTVTATSQVLAPSPYAGMNATITPFTLAVTADQIGGGEVKLQRNVQLVAIPVFQFGIYSDSDLAFFNGPQFDFGGRVHTNGNLWLAPNSGPLFLADKVTVVGQIIRTNLENGYPGGGTTLTPSTDYSGTVSVALTPNPTTLPPSTSTPAYSNTQWWPLDTTDSSVGGSSVYGDVSTTPGKSLTWYTSTYNGMMLNDVAPLSLTSTALGGLTTPISLIRRPIANEATSNPSLFDLRYFSEATVRILLDDYATPGVQSSGCAGSDMMNLTGDGISATTPVDLTTLANIAESGATHSGTTGPYTIADGYWIQKTKPTITGCIKIEYQNTAGTFTDITSTILALGYRGRNINPQSAAALAPSTATPCQAAACTHASAGDLLALNGVPLATDTAMNLGSTITNASLGSYYVFPNYNFASGQKAPTGGTLCSEPDSGAIIRIERVRDNPANEYTAYHNGCGNEAGEGALTQADYWPMALFDTREALNRAVQEASTDVPQDASHNPLLTAQGVMDYIELDVNNLATWLKNNQTTLSLYNSTGYTVYFSDRRGEQVDNTAVVGTGLRTGSFGYNDITNGTYDAAHGCPDGSLDAGEDLEGDGVLRTYGGTETTVSNLITGLLASGTYSVLEPDSTFSLCSSLLNTWPGALYVHIQEARENPPVFFRHALKLVDGQTINAGTTCFTGGVPACGLTIGAENPVYIEGDYNAPNSGTFPSTSVATSVAADAVTLLSDGWNDVNSFISPYTSDARPGRQTAYRVALIGGKDIPFAQPSGQPEDFGTDGGLHNFLRFLENMGPPTGIGFNSNVPTGGQTIYYLGSLVSFYYNRQGIGEYKGDVDTVYTPPTRNYSFDTNFTLGTQYLPPKTPVLRTINTTGFTQEINPTQ